MSWLRNNQIAASFGTKRHSSSPPKTCDPLACTESFKKHWQQAREIIERTQAPEGYPLQDDILAVVNHLGQITTLALMELQRSDKSDSTLSSPLPCLEHLLSENILEKVFDWSIHTGRFKSAVKLEQLKLYELFVGHAGQQLLVHEPFLRPLLKLLTSCTGEVHPVEVEKRLVLLLNQLCVSVMQNIELLDLFFCAPSDKEPSKFLLFSLLIPFVHREGSIGQQARDALLLCMSMSKKNNLVGAYITEYSNVCPVLATGLSGLYSLLPRKLDVETEDWHRLTPDDINELDELTLFINSFEFCNAVAQVAHPSVQDQLLEFIYQGFLVPVMGPALLQSSLGLGVRHPAFSSLEASTIDELVAATAYYELFIRNATNPGLLQTLVRFLMRDCYDGQRILNTLIVRINSPTRLCLVTLSLLETLINLDSEEVMFELVLKHLAPCTHVMLSQRRRLREVDPYTPSALKFLSLTPSCCCGGSRPDPRPSRSSRSLRSSVQSHVYGLRPEESLYGNYHAYLCDAKSKIESCAKNCKNWSRPYDGEEPSSKTFSILELSCRRKSSAIQNVNCDKNGDSLQSAGDSSGYNSFATTKGSPETTPSENETEDLQKNLTDSENGTKSGGYSSGSLGSTTPSSDIGPFLDAVLKCLERMPRHSLYVNLRLTAIVSRLAVYPQPLLSSLLLNHSLVFQPSIRSLFQVLGSLKQKLDGSLNRVADVETQVHAARTFLLEREERLANMRKTAVEAPTQRRFSTESFSRGESKRRSFSFTLSSVLKRAMQTTSGNVPPVERLTETDVRASRYRYTKTSGNEANEEEEIRGAVLCAVLLDEWLKELAAIAQEHTLYSLSDFS